MSFLSDFRDSWNNRHQWGDDNKSRELAEFLPAALEIQNAPQNPIAKWLGRCLMLLFTLAIIWACLGEVNIVASAEGKIIPSARVKKIQPLEKAVVKHIFVKEGQHVTEGEPLIELDRVTTLADEKRIMNDLYHSKLNLSVQNGLLGLLEVQQTNNDQKTKSQIPQNILELTLQIDTEVNDDDLLLYKRLLWQQWQQYLTQYQSLRSSLDKNKAEYAAANESVKKLRQTLPIITSRVHKVKSLLKKNYASEVQYMELEQERIEQAQDLAVEKQRLNQLQATKSEIAQNIANLIAQTRAQTLMTITESQRQITSLEEELIKASDINAKQVLYAPASGQVQQLIVNTIGGVVNGAEELMLIVPDTEKLEVEVFLENKDIGFVNEGMTAEIKVHTFPFVKYGIIDAEIITVSDDAILDEKRGLIYSMSLLMKKNALMVEGKEVKLMPGMAVTAEVQTGYRHIIEFFLAPLLRYRQEGLRER